MEQSIFLSTKKILGIAPDDASFDLDVLTHINSAFSTLHQLGVGLPEGFSIEDEEATWPQFIDGFPEFGPQLGQIKTLIYLKVRMYWDPPQTGFLVTSMEKQISEAEWRLNVARESAQWSDPTPTIIEDDLEVIEGGDAFGGP